MAALLAVPVLAMAWCLRCIVKFRICVVGAHRFGHLALEPEMWLSNRALNSRKHGPVEVDIWSLGSRRIRSNSYLAELWSRRLRRPPSWIVGALVQAGEMLPPLALERADLSIFGPNNGLDRSPRFLPDAEQWSAKEVGELRDFNFDPLRPFVALVIRDSAHYVARGEAEHESTAILNGELERYLSACQFLVDRGLQVIRLGGPSLQRVPQLPGIFDYANSSIRSHRSDVLLALGCQFVISNQTGPDAVALAGRRPVLYIDVLRLSQFFLGTQLATWVPVTIKDLASGRPWSLRKLCSTELLQAKDPQVFLDWDVEVSKASEHEILSYVSGYHDEFTVSSSRIQGGAKRKSQLQSQACEVIGDAMGEWGSRRFGNIVALPSNTWIQANSSWWLAND